MLGKKMKRIFAVLLAFLALFTQSNMLALAAETDQNEGSENVTQEDTGGTTGTGVALYKNGSLVGIYNTINEAFDLMTDAAADYTVNLYADQVLEGYAQWPNVKSITIMPDLENDARELLCLSAEKTTFNSNVCLFGGLCFMPYVEAGQTVYAEVDLQGYTLTCTEEQEEWAVYIGYPGYDAIAGFDISGDVDSKIAVESLTQFFNSSMQVDELELIHLQQESGAAAAITLYYPRQNSSINTIISQFETVSPIEVRGYTDIKSKLTIGEIKFAERVTEGALYPEFTILNEGNVDVEVGTVSENAKLSLVYESTWALETATFSYTGSTVPRGIGVTYYMTSQGGAMGPTDVEALSVIPENEVILYAPNVPSDVVTIGYRMQNTMNNVSYHAPAFSGSWKTEDGYYNTNDLPKIIPSDVVYIITEDCQKELTYSGVNANGELKSVTWTARNTDTANDYMVTDVTDTVIGAYDENSLSLSFDKLEEGVWTELFGTFEYESGTLLYQMMVFYSAPASNVSFTETEKNVEFYGDVSRVSLELNYDAKEEPLIIITNTDYNILYAFSLDGNTLSFMAADTGTAIVRAYVGGEVAECRVIVGGAEEDISDGWNQADDGNWYYYTDGKVDTSVNGLVYNESFDEWWYAVEGKADFTYMGLTCYYDVWYYVENGVLNWNYTGLTLYYGTWYYVENGMLNWDYTGLTQYYDTWYYVEGGILNWGYTGLTCYYDTWYYVEGGVLNWGYTGLTCYYDTWYYVQGGVLNWGYTGLCEYYGGWYYVEGGVLNWNYAGLCEYYGVWYYIGNGVLDWNFTGNVYFNGMWWYVENGVMVGVA